LKTGGAFSILYLRSNLLLKEHTHSHEEKVIHQAITVHSARTS
jgi:hypothetical protein